VPAPGEHRRRICGTSGAASGGAGHRVNYVPLILFVVATAGTPGPNNTMIFSSGATFGVRRSVRHVAGINVGFPIMVVIVGLGLGPVARGTPLVLDLLKPVAIAYLGYLAFRIATGPTTYDQASLRKPLSFTRAALFQWVNPKAWILAVGVTAAFAGRGASAYGWHVLSIALTFAVFSTPCTMCWLVAGAILGRILTTPSHVRILNVGLAALLVSSLVPII
jgi:threonine/homoserine/homoserine lactone efflux protein